MVDDGLRQGMVEWVRAMSCATTSGLDAHVLGQDGDLAQRRAQLAPERPVTVLGLGEMGLSAALALPGLGFPVTGWSRRPREEPRLARTLAGRGRASPEALGGGRDRGAPPALTPDTENLMDARASRCRRGASRSSTPGGARSSTTRRSSPRWTRARWATPRSTSSAGAPAPGPPLLGASPRDRHAPRRRRDPPRSAARVIAENLRRGEAGEPLLHLVDRAAGY
jgi:glyoxylate/hydroxypyruvate reductase A